MADGRILTEECLQLTGLRTTAESRDKFFDCAVPVLGPKTSVTAFDTLREFENIRNISDLMPSLTVF